MIDIHCHILPGVDDGAENEQESIIMADIAAESGTKELIMTPHCCAPRGFANLDKPALEAEFAALRACAARCRIPIKLHCGMEVFAANDFEALLDSGLLFTLAGSDYLLIEFAFDEMGMFIERCVQAVLSRGLTPIIAHPERYYFMQDEPEFMRHCALDGAKLQLNCASLDGGFGRSAKRAAHWALEHGCAHFIASDAHGPFMRSPALDAGYDLIEDLYGHDAAELLFCLNPAAVIKNRKVYAPLDER